MDESPKIRMQLKVDRKNNSRKSFLVLFFYRLMHMAYERKLSVLLFLLSVIKGVVYFLFRIDSQISYKAKIGWDIRFPHSAMGVVISSYAEIGNHITIYHQVTVGINENLPSDLRRVVIEDGCYLSVGCKVINSVVGERSKIGPNAVVYKDLPADSLWVVSGDNLRSK